MNGVKCNLCLAPVRFAKTVGGRTICFDREPDTVSGQWKIDGDPPVCTEAKVDDFGQLYALHTLTCKFRTRAARAGGK